MDYWRNIRVWGIATDIFQINLKNSSGDIVMHFNPRLKDKIVVRNSQRGGQWGAEERAGDFPFAKNKVFDVLIDEQQRGTFAVHLHNVKIVAKEQCSGVGQRRVVLYV